MATKKTRTGHYRLAKPKAKTTKKPKINWGRSTNGARSKRAYAAIRG